VRKGSVTSPLVALQPRAGRDCRVATKPAVSRCSLRQALIWLAEMPGLVPEADVARWIAHPDADVASAAKRLLNARRPGGSARSCAGTVHMQSACS
jgi:hypothetical protein